MHEKKTTDAFTLVFAGIVDKRTLLQGAGIDTDKSETADVRVCLNLER